MPLAAARALSGAAASTSGGPNAGSASFRVAGGRRGARRRPHCSPAAPAAAAVAVSVVARPLPRRCRKRLLLIVSASSSASSSSSSSSSSSQPPPPQLFGPPPFDPTKLTVTLLPGAEKEGSSSSSSSSSRRGGNGASSAASKSKPSGSCPSSATPLFPLPRRYTLTHNDVTGALALSIGPNYNSAQLEGWYVRMIRDEVLAEWRRDEGGEKEGGGKEATSVDGNAAGGKERSSSSSGSSSDSPAPPPPSASSGHSLHVFCHVSGDARWLAPPRLRSRIFQREMALVLDTIAHADADLLRENPGLSSASVVVHLRSHVASLDARVVWGTLGDRRGWREPPRLLEGLLEGVVSDLWRELGGGTELRADSLGFDSDGSDFDGVGLSSSSSASSADFYYDGASESRAALNDEEMGALMSDDSFIAMAERDTVDDDDEGEVEGEDEGAGAPSRNKGSALRI